MDPLAFLATNGIVKTFQKSPLISVARAKPDDQLWTSR